MEFILRGGLEGLGAKMAETGTGFYPSSRLHSFRNGVKVTLFHPLTHYLCPVHLFSHCIVPENLELWLHSYFKEFLLAVEVWGVGGWLSEWACDDQSSLTPEMRVCNFMTWGLSKQHRLAQKCVLVLLLGRSAGSASECSQRELLLWQSLTHTFLSGQSCCQPRFGLCNVGLESKMFKKKILEGISIIYLINESVR